MKTIRVIRTLDCGSPVGDWVGDFEIPTRCKYPTIKNIYRSFGTVGGYLGFKFNISLEIVLTRLLPAEKQQNKPFIINFFLFIIQDFGFKA